MNPSISIIIPVYNAAKYLTTCLDSILTQKFKDFELILINDGSNDGSKDICDLYASRDSRVRAIHQDNQGVSIARNVGITNAKGKWFFFADADDILLPNTLTSLYRSACDNGADIVLGSCYVLNDNKISPLLNLNDMTSSSVYSCLKNSALWGYLINSEIITNNNLLFVPKLAYSEDTLFLSLVATYCKKITLISDFVYIYRRNTSSVCSSKNGLKKSYHQFYAAYSLKSYIDSNRNPLGKRFLINRQKMLLKRGYYDFVSNSFSWANYDEYKHNYLLFFNGENVLFLRTLCAYISYNRRKYVRFKDNPLCGEIGMISKIRKYFNIRKL